MTKITLTEASRRTGMSKKSLSDAIKNGRLPAPRGPRGYYEIDPADLDKLSSRPTESLSDPIKNGHLHDIDPDNLDKLFPDPEQEAVATEKKDVPPAPSEAAPAKPAHNASLPLWSQFGKAIELLFEDIGNLLRRQPS